MADTTSAPPPAGHNAEPWEIELDEAREHINAEELIAATDDYEKITNGAFGFAYTNVLANKIGLTPAMFAAWTQNDPTNKVEQYIREVHNLSGSKDRQIIQEEMSAAIYAAVCASSEDVAKAAKEGNKDDTDPNMRAKINAVRSQTYGTGDGQIATRESAVNVINRRLEETKNDPEVNAVWKNAKAAIDQILPIRRMATDLATAQVRATRWRLAAFMPLVRKPLETYANAHGNDKMALITTKALTTARKVHKDYRNTIVTKGLKQEPAKLVAAVHEEVQKDILDKLMIVGGVVRSDEEIMTDINAKLWRILAQVDNLWSTHATDRMKQFFHDVNRDEPSESFPVALTPPVKTKTTGAQTGREAAEDAARTDVKDKAGAATSQQKAQSEANQRAREQKAAAGAAAASQTPASPSRTLANLKKRNAPAPAA